MMNLFRYPSLFRIFAILGFLLLVGLAFRNYQPTLSSHKDWLRLRISTLALLLGIGSIFIYALQKSAWRFPEQFSAESLITFFNTSNNSEMVLIQAPIQIILLSLLLFKSYIKKGIPFLRFVAILLLVDLFLAVQLNSFLTITSEARVAPLQEKIDTYPNSFPVPDEKIINVSHHGNKATYPIWYNLNILQKRVANNGYNNFKFRAFRSFKDRQGHEKILDHFLLYRPDNPSLDSTGLTLRDQIIIKNFTPNKIEAKVNFKEAGELVLLQYFYPGWSVQLDGKDIPAFQKEELFLAVNIPAGEHQLSYTFYPKYFIPCLLLSFGSLLGLLLYLSIKTKP